MSHAIEFIETSIFTRQIKALATDDELKALQVELIAQPDIDGALVGGASLDADEFGRICKLGR